MKKDQIKNYFITFGNDPYDPKYWERDYVMLYQIIIGIVFLPIMMIGYIVGKIFGLKIKIKSNQE